jgi:hypothetical protein
MVAKRGCNHSARLWLLCNSECCEYIIAVWEHEGTFDNQQRNKMAKNYIKIPVCDREDYCVWKKLI